MVRMVPEYLVLGFASDDDPEHPDMGSGEAHVGFDDPRLNETQWSDTEADAFASHVAVKIMVDSSGEPSSVSIRWN